jgi:cell wall-associated NlpC family hydrolase
MMTWADTDSEFQIQMIDTKEETTDTEQSAAAAAMVDELISEDREAEEDDTEEITADDSDLEALEALEDAEDAEELSIRQKLVNYALQFVGRPYRAGGSDPNTGADCSGFVRYVMAHGAGINMNRSSREQATQGTQISAAQMQPGDLLFYSHGSRIDHVAMYIGDGRIVHASTERTGIKTSKWNYRTPVRIVSMFG